MFQLNYEEKMWVEECWKKLDRKLKIVAERSVNKIPFWSECGIHNDVKKTSIAGWANGFWPGLMWMMYIATGNEAYK